MKNIQIKCPKCGAIIQLDADKLYASLHLKVGAENAIDMEVIEDAIQIEGERLSD